MQSTAKTVDAYIDEAPTERRAALTHLRTLCRSILSGYEESMEYGMPGYKKNGVTEVGFASQKHYIALYILKQEALAPCRPLLTGLSVGKGCIRYPKPEKINFAVVEKLLMATVQSNGPIC
jgi:uncharacterized protein YdhG (YjbR/CyaY superfamily)